MTLKRKYRGLKTVLAVFFVLVMLLLCHCAATPFQLLPSGFRYALYPVGSIGVEGAVQPWDLVVCDRANSDALTYGAVVRFRQSMFSSLSLYAGGGASFGRVLAYDPERSDSYRYTVQFEYGDAPQTLKVAQPELAVYRVAGLGGAVLALHANRHLVWGLCGGLSGLWIIFTLVTAKRRRIRRSRRIYLAMFDRFAQEYEKNEADF